MFFNYSACLLVFFCLLNLVIMFRLFQHVIVKWSGFLEKNLVNDNVKIVFEIVSSNF